ncbi:MAG TPA: tRNA (cytidine(56)-2'-O)-methyltransferase, partial [Thermoplasmatales archaeon]|nr:tRNA (cytidine(56)-2'-O)-methyltransferase [Thermoplasmatales archaeon]
VKNWRGIIVHLTMYGADLRKTIPKIPRDKDILVVVGSEKVPPFFYEHADFNISIGNQPHSEVAALAIFLDRFTEGRWLDKKFDGKIIIHPSDKGKDVTIKED